MWIVLDTKVKKRPFSGHINVDYSNVVVHASDEKKKLPPVGLDLIITGSRVMKMSEHGGTIVRKCKRGGHTRARVQKCNVTRVGTRM